MPADKPEITRMPLLLVNILAGDCGVLFLLKFTIYEVKGFNPLSVIVPCVPRQEVGLLPPALLITGI